MDAQPLSKLKASSHLKVKCFSGDNLAMKNLTAPIPISSAIGAISSSDRSGFLDLISSSMLAASLGFGVFCASGFVLVFQGALVALAMALGSFLNDFAVNELICAGSVMITALGLNLIGVTKIKVANLLPGLIFVPFVCKIMELF